MTEFATKPVAAGSIGTLAQSPSLIERIWPAQKLSAEAQKERKAVQGQTLNALGSYWKGRKPLILVRACVLGALLPATDDPAEDLAVFELLMNIDDDAFAIRDRSAKPNEIASLLLSAEALSCDQFTDWFVVKPAVPDADVEQNLEDVIASAKLSWSPSISTEQRREIVAKALSTLPYATRVGRARRPEEAEEAEFAYIWPRVNAHLGTNAGSLAELVAEIGERRFGRLPRVADTFAGGGAIPFEAARLGCVTYASDLNPIACMLTWAGLNVVGATSAEAEELLNVQSRIVAEVESTFNSLGIERDGSGNQAKAYLYCMEARCPSSGWLVPMLPNFIVSRSRNCIVRLLPNRDARRYDIEIVASVSDEEMKGAETGTMVGGYLTHEVDGVAHRTSLKTIRGDYRSDDGATRNNLRPWLDSEFMPAESDILQERLYCIQWIAAGTLGSPRQTTFFKAVGPEDIERERIAEDHVRKNLQGWRDAGLIGDMPIMDGAETSRLRRERGWTCWHHLFTPRELIILSSALRIRHPATYLYVAAQLDYMSKLVEWRTVKGGGTGGPVETPNHVFYNQALNTFYNYANRSAYRFCQRDYFGRLAKTPVFARTAEIVSAPASSVDRTNDLFITDPPYADAVSYHEITEFFIAWLRKNAPAPFDNWLWDSRRPLAIKGDGEEFRREMVAAYQAMAAHMPDNGLQIVMFTHQSGSVWADMAQIFWGAGLQVQAAWYIATETTSEIKKGGYVQGTVILVLRKRLGATSGYEDEIVQDVRVEVAHQIETLVGLNQSLKGSGRIENVFEDADLQMAGYAAALRVLTGYTRIDGRDMTVEALRTRRKGEVGFVDRMIEYAVAVANEHMVPDGIRPQLWQQFRGPERFYLKMMDLEAAGIAKLDNYQNFARAFRVADYTQFMSSMKPNAAQLKTASEFGPRSGFDIADFSNGIVRSTLFGIDALSRDMEADDVLLQLRDLVPDYFKKRAEMIEIADYVVRQRARESEEGRNGAVFANLLRNERL
jgi:adenine-specific DNA methylase